MLCRRCGMESNATDICEWCKRPMLPTGAVIAAEASLPGGRAETATSPRSQTRQGPPVVKGGALAPDEDIIIADASQEEATATEVLRPLGAELGPKPLAPQPGALSHGVSEEATRTSVDIKSYLGPGDSLFRPMSRPEHGATASGIGDPLALRRGRSSTSGRAVSEIPDNVKLLRSLITGLVISFPLAIAQYLVVHSVPEKLYFLKLGSGSSILTAVLWGLTSGALFGFGLGALLVQFKKGAFLGLIMGLAIGHFGLDNAPWSDVAGAISGFMAGRIAMQGYRRTLQV